MDWPRFGNLTALVEAYGGRIWVESERLCGATFEFTLPSSLEVAEIAEHLGVCNATVYRLCDSGELPHVLAAAGRGARCSSAGTLIDEMNSVFAADVSTATAVLRRPISAAEPDFTDESVSDGREPTAHSPVTAAPGTTAGRSSGFGP